MSSAVLNSPLIGSTLLIAGCCIGAGMLSLPVVSAMAGFIPSTLAMLLCCAFMTCTGLLVLEAALWFDKEICLLSIADFALGKAGRIITGILFLSVFYCLIVAYTAGGGELFSSLFSAAFGIPISRHVGAVACTFLVGVTVYAGTIAVDKANRVMMGGLILSYVALIGIGFANVDPQQLLLKNYPAVFASLPIMIVSFGYHNLIPSLVHYLKRNIVQLRLAVLIGNLIPLTIYLLWNGVILGLLQDQAALTDVHSEMATHLLSQTSGSPYVIACVNAFSIFAILTSFLANALSCMDFIRDGLKISSPQSYRLPVCILVLLPPLLCSFVHPHLFLRALGFAGGFATVILFGIIPVVVVWKGRYQLGIQSSYRVFGGKGLLIGIFILSLSFMGLEFLQQLQR